MTTQLIRETLDTARITAYCRAVESEREAPLFRDPYARQLAGERGEELVRALPGGDQISKKIWPIVTRTYVYDEIILRVIEQEEIDTVINLAAGLDTRPYRLPLPSSLRWIETDFPDALAYKEELLATAQPVCQLERVSLDIADDAARRGFLSQVGAESKHGLIISEGLLIYLTEQLVTSIAGDLRKQSAFRWWLTEFVTPAVLDNDKRQWNTFSAENVQTRFAPPGGIDFFQLHGWSAAEIHSLIAEGLRLNMPIPYGWLLRLLSFIASHLPETTEKENYTLGGFLLLKHL